MELQIQVSKIIYPKSKLKLDKEYGQFYFSLTNESKLKLIYIMQPIKTHNRVNRAFTFSILTSNCSNPYGINTH